MPPSPQSLQYTAIALNDESFMLDIIKRSQTTFCNDPWFAKVKQSCASSSASVSTSASSPSAPAMSALKQHTYAVRNGVVCRLQGDYFAPVVPPSDRDLQRLILLELHSSGLGGHLALRKMHKEVSNRFFWPGLKKDVEKFVKQCVVCQAGRSSTQKPVGLLHPHDIPSRPFDIVSMDFITGLPLTARGNDAILTIVDHFSKYITLLAIPATTDAHATA